MKLKVIPITMVPLCLTFATLGHAQQGYTTSQSPSGGYTTSTTPAPGYNTSNSGYSSGQSYNSTTTTSTSPSFNPGYTSGPSVQSTNTYAIAHKPKEKHHSLFGIKFKIKEADRYREPYWDDMFSNYPIPSYAIVGGLENNSPYPLYICHGYYRNGIHPGKVVAGRCNITWGGREISLSNYQVLGSRIPLSWIPASNGFVPVNAVPGGVEYNKPLYICQANYNGGMHPGKMVGRNCNIGYAGREISVPDYNILVR